jgi:predicted esterase YcpF (UPF0227 family)
MKKVIVYCHGYGSNTKSGKVQQLKDAGFETYCFKADIDPDIACESLCDNIDLMLLDYLHQEIKLIFVGTSLGGWMASKLAEAYYSEAIIINPSSNSRESLAKYGIAEEIRNKYSKLKPNNKFRYYFSANDPVIDHREFIEACSLMNCNSMVLDSEDHRFTKEFDLVIDYLKSI